MRAGEICKRTVVVARRSTPLNELAQLFRRNLVGSIVIVEDADTERPVGIVTDRDIVVEVIAPGLDPYQVTAGDIMTSAPAVARKDESALWSLKTMRDRGIRRLPVVDDAGALVGIISFDDLVEHVGMALMSSCSTSSQEDRPQLGVSEGELLIALGDIVQALAAQHSVDRVAALDESLPLRRR